MYAAHAIFQNPHHSAATNTVSCGLAQRADRMKISDQSCSTVHHLYSSLAPHNAARHSTRLLTCTQQQGNCCSRMEMAVDLQEHSAYLCMYNCTSACCCL